MSYPAAPESALAAAAADASPAPDTAGADHHEGHEAQGLVPLAVGAIGVVFGDIGTSPLYSLKESFIGHHRLAVDADHIFGVLSLMFWTMTLIVTVKYVFVILRADNKGEGGSLALLALIGRQLKPGRWTAFTVVLGIVATALFYGDAIITPAVSVLSAVEGLTVVHPAFAEVVLPISIAILIGLFAIQSRGTAAVGKLFGPVMLVYFLVIAVLGLNGIARAPEILLAANPWYALKFFTLDPLLADNDVAFLVAPTRGPAWMSDLVLGDQFNGSIGFGSPAAIAGYPHLTVPMGEVEQLPVGISFFGAKWADHDVLKAGAAYERARTATLPEPSFKRWSARAMPE